MVTTAELVRELERLGLKDAFVVRVAGTEAELRDAEGRGQGSSAVVPAETLLSTLRALYPVSPEARIAAVEEEGPVDIAWREVWEAVVAACPDAATHRTL
jgi:hypothetical protein